MSAPPLRFQLIRRLGKGGMGTVFEALDRERQVRVAIKQLSSSNPELLLRFKREFRSLQSVHHPNLVSLGEMFETDGVWFFTMELLSGVELLPYVRGEGQDRDLPFDLARLRSAFHQLALGIAALHRHGHIHRDLKPSNVLVTPDNRVVILDFGLVRAADHSSAESSAGIVFGTPEYMAPEQASGAEVTRSADWYALGSLLYDAITGAPPFVGRAVDVMVRKQMADPPSPARKVPNLPADLESLCMALLRRDPAARPEEPEILKRLYVELRRDDRTFLTLPLRPGGERFVGRAAELAAMDQLWAEARAGETRTLLVSGAGGIGKSALLRELARRRSSEAQPPLVWSGRCTERETIPFKAVDMLVDDASRLLARVSAAAVPELVPEDIDLLARTFPVLQRVDYIAQLPLRSFENWDRAERRKRLFDAFRELFRRVAAARPMVVLIDDLHAADADGLALLSHLLDAHDLPLLFVGAVRAESLAAVAQALGCEGRQCDGMALDVLAPEEATALAREWWPEADASAVATEAGGHPAFIREICIAREVGPVDLRGALRRRISTLPADARRLLEVVAVASVPPTQSVAAARARIAGADLQRCFSLLRAAELVRTIGLRRTDAVEIANDAVRETVVDGLSADRLAELHAGLAESFEQLAGYEEAAAQHWVDAGELERAHQVLAAAVDRATAAEDPERAAALQAQLARIPA